MTERNEFEHDATDTATANSRRRAPKRILLLALFAMLVLSTLLSGRIRTTLRKAMPFAVPYGSGNAVKIAEPDYSSEMRRYNEAVTTALDAHLKRLGQIAEEFEKGLRENGPGRFDQPRAAIPAIRQSFSGFDAMAGVVKDGALDKAFGGDRLLHRFNAALDKPFLRPCACAGESLIADYETCAARMSAESAAFREELALAHGSLPKAVRVGFPAESLRDGMAQTYEALGGMPLKAGLVAAETAIEVATVRSTIASVKNLALRYGGKAMAKGAATAIAPGADGPFPFGDVAAVVFAAWTVSDIHNLARVLPREIEKSLLSTVNAIQAQTIDAVSDAVRKTRKEHEKAARSLAAAACAELGVG